MMNAFLGLSDLDKDPEIKLKNKERIVFATMKSYIPLWEKPKEWDSLTTKVKLNRLEDLQNMIRTNE